MHVFKPNYIIRSTEINIVVKLTTENVATITSRTSEKKKAILELLRHSDRPLNAKELAHSAKLNGSTVRSYLRQLNSAGQVQSPYRGDYVINPNYGVGDAAVPKVHNVRVKFLVYGNVPTGRIIEEVGCVKFDVSFGSKRGKVYGIISCDAGLDYNAFCLAICHFKEIVKRKLSLEVGDGTIQIDGIELNEDFFDLRIEKGGEVLTVQNIKGSLERIYNKDNFLRSEVKVKPDNLYSIYTLLKGGTSSYNILQGIFLQNQKIGELTEAIKFNNEVSWKNSHLLEAILEKLGNLSDRDYSKLSNKGEYP